MSGSFDDPIVMARAAVKMAEEALAAQRRLLSNLESHQRELKKQADDNKDKAASSSALATSPKAANPNAAKAKPKAVKRKREKEPNSVGTVKRQMQSKAVKPKEDYATKYPGLRYVFSPAGRQADGVEQPMDMHYYYDCDDHESGPAFIIYSEVAERGK